MSQFFQAVAAVLLAVILILILQKHGKDTALLLALLVCCMLGALAVSFLQPVMDFFRKLQAVGVLEDTMLRTLLKVVGIAMTGEIAGLICSDSGNGALAKMLQFLSSAVILWLSLPLFTKLLELVEGILGNV